MEIRHEKNTTTIQQTTILTEKDEEALFRKICGGDGDGIRF